MSTEKRPPTLKTIAYMTGFSITAVSRALKDAPDISDKTKERVRMVADKIGYRPSRAGLRLRTGKTQVISLILDIDEKIMGLTTQMVAGISRRLHGSSYHIVVTPYSRDQDPLDPVRYVVETGSADAVIISRTQPDDHRVRYLIDNNMHFITHGRTKMGLTHPWIDYDNTKFAYHGAQRLHLLGAKNVSALLPEIGLNYWRNLRDGFERGCAQFGMAEIPLTDVTIEETMDEIEEGIFKLMRSSNRPDGILVASGSAAIAATSGIERAGLEVGREVQLVAKENTNILHRFRPAVNAFYENVPEAGWYMADFALRLIEGEDPATLNHLQFTGYDERDLSADIGPTPSTIPASLEKIA